MFGVLFKQNRKATFQKQVAPDLYQAALQGAREEIFYAQHGVPDSFDGRFDLMLLHLFCILDPLVGHDEYDDLSQYVFDVTFRNMDQTLREMGIGDMGIPKHMKRMMKAFNGRMHSYREATHTGDDEVMHDVLKRNLFGTAEGDVSKESIEAVSEFIRHNYKQDPEDIAQGRVKFNYEMLKG